MKEEEISIPRHLYERLLNALQTWLMPTDVDQYGWFNNLLGELEKQGQKTNLKTDLIKPMTTKQIENKLKELEKRVELLERINDLEKRVKKLEEQKTSSDNRERPFKWFIGPDPGDMTYEVHYPIMIN